MMMVGRRRRRRRRGGGAGQVVFVLKGGNDLFCHPDDGGDVRWWRWRWRFHRSRSSLCHLLGCWFDIIRLVAVTGNAAAMAAAVAEISGGALRFGSCLALLRHGNGALVIDRCAWGGYLWIWKYEQMIIYCSYIQVRTVPILFHRHHSTFNTSFNSNLFGVNH